MRFFEFKIDTIEFKAVIRIQSDELITAIKKVEFLVKNPEYWKIQNETTIMSIKS